MPTPTVHMFGEQKVFRKLEKRLSKVLELDEKTVEEEVSFPANNNQKERERIKMSRPADRLLQHTIS